MGNIVNKILYLAMYFFLSCLDLKEGFCLKACLIFPVTPFYLTEDITSLYKPCPASAHGYSILMQTCFNNPALTGKIHVH